MPGEPPLRYMQKIRMKKTAGGSVSGGFFLHEIIRDRPLIRDEIPKVSYNKV